MDVAVALGAPLQSTPKPQLPLSRRHLANLNSRSLIPHRSHPFLTIIPRIAAGHVPIFQQELDHLLHNHPDLKLTPPDSLLHLIHSLHLAGITGPALHRTITRHPDILASSHIQPFLDFVTQELQGLQPTKLERLLVSTSPRILTNFIASIAMLVNHGFPREKLGHLINNVDTRKVFDGRPVKELEEMVLFLERYGWPELIVRRPMLLNLDLHRQLIPRVEFLVELAEGDEAAAAILIGKRPGILAYTVEHFQSHMEFWRSIGLTDEQVFKIAMVYPNVFSISRDRKLKPRIEFLLQCGLSADDMFRFLIKAPLFLSLSFEDNLSKKMVLLVKLGYCHRTREMALALGATTRTSCENLQLVLGVFFSYGLSSEDVLDMSKKHPQVLQYSHESLDKKIKFLIEEMERNVGELLVFPAFLGYKLDDRIKRRYQAQMKTKGKGNGMSLNKLLSVSTARFVLPDEKPDMDTVEL